MGKPWFISDYILLILYIRGQKTCSDSRLNYFLFCCCRDAKDGIAMNVLMKYRDNDTSTPSLNLVDYQRVSYVK